MAGRRSRCYILGEFLLDSDEHRLIRGGKEIPLRPKSYELLLYLVEHHGRFVSKEELLNAVWPDSYITEGTLRQTVWEIREALGDHEEQQRLIKTIPKVGYQFVGEVEERKSESSIARGRNRKALLAIMAGILIVLGSLSLVFLWQWPKSPQPESKSPLVVVLPFENLNPNPEDEYFSEGVSERITNILSRFNNLRVLPLLRITHSMRSGDLKKDIKAIVEELEVTALVEGSARFEEGRVRISARLVDAVTGEQLWGKNYEEELAGVNEIQGNVARSVATALKGRLSVTEGKLLGKMPPERVEAQELTMRGGYFLRMGDNDLAINCYQRAITTDPDYARPYALLAVTLVNQAPWMVPKEERGKIRAQAEEAIRKAVELDKSIPVSPLALAILRELWGSKPDWAGAEELFKTAIDLDPNWWHSYAKYSMLLTRLGRFEEALDFAQLADQLDPYREETIVKVAYLCLHTGHPDKALETARKLAELYPERIGSYVMLAEVYRAMGSFEQAIAVLNQARDKLKNQPANGYIALLGHLNILTGANAEARDCLRRLGDLERVDAIPDTAEACCWHLAGIHMALGEEEKALDYLEKCGLRIVGGPCKGIAQDPLWDPLRTNPRFQEMLQKTNLPASSIRKPSAG